MPRSLDELQASTSGVDELSRDLGVTRRTSRSFAAAVAVLMLATIVVDRSSNALNSESASASSAINSGTIELTDDDGGRSLFVLEDLTPARPAVRCIEITYSGTILPVLLNLRAEAQGELANYLDVTITEGAGGNYGSCVGFVGTRDVYTGVLAELIETNWIPVGNLVNTGEVRSFRIELQLQDRQDALGQSTSLEFAWEVVPS